MTEMLNTTLLRAKRKSAKLTTAEAAKAIGKTSTAIWRYENDVTLPSIDTLLAMLKVYGAEIKDVFVRLPEKEREDIALV